jgi:hypothetical protein
MRGANCDSNHFLIRTIIRQKISRLYQKKQKCKFKWDINKLENKDKKKDYQEHITEELKRIEGKHDVNEEWISIKNALLEITKVETGEQRKERNQDWYDEEYQIAMKEKNDARKKCLNKETRKNREEYEEKRKIAIKLCRRKKREMWNKKIEEIKGTNIKKNTRKFYKEVKEMRKDYQQQNVICKDAKGKILTEEKGILLRWQQYFRLLLEDELQPLEENEKENIEELEDIDKPTYEEMIKVIRNIKNGKAPGTDNITVELIGIICPILKKEIVETVVTTEESPC